MFTPIDIRFDTVKHHKYKIDCYFSTDKHLAYRIPMGKGKSGTAKHTRAFECFIAIHLAEESRYDRHIINCSGIPRNVYKFYDKNLASFEDNFKYWGDLLFAAYCDFETRTTSGAALDPENTEMFAISYAIFLFILM